MVGTFTAVNGLYVSLEFTPRIAPTLQELVGETKVLPSAGSFLEGDTLIATCPGGHWAVR